MEENKIENPPQKFRFNARAALFTYIDREEVLSREEVLEHFTEVIRGIEYAISCSEICPRTGTCHVHIFVIFTRAPDIKSRERLLIRGLGVNVQPIKRFTLDNLVGMRDYCLKSDPDYAEEGKFNPLVKITGY